MPLRLVGPPLQSIAAKNPIRQTDTVCAHLRRPSMNNISMVAIPPPFIGNFKSSLADTILDYKAEETVETPDFEG